MLQIKFRIRGEGRGGERRGGGRGEERRGSWDSSSAFYSVKMCIGYSCGQINFFYKQIYNE